MLRPIGVMQQYLRHGIENHPAISAEYVRFLVANSALDSVMKIDGEIKALTNKIDKIASKAKAAQSTACTA